VVAYEVGLLTSGRLVLAAATLRMWASTLQQSLRRISAGSAAPERGCSAVKGMQYTT